ncbi:hypothetical protein Dimus_015755 [Dionaea muscipula]
MFQGIKVIWDNYKVIVVCGLSREDPVTVEVEVPRPRGLVTVEVQAPCPKDDPVTVEVKVPRPRGLETVEVQAPHPKDGVRMFQGIKVIWDNSEVFVVCGLSREDPVTVEVEVPRPRGPVTMEVQAPRPKDGVRRKELNRCMISRGRSRRFSNRAYKRAKVVHYKKTGYYRRHFSVGSPSVHGYPSEIRSNHPSGKV